MTTKVAAIQLCSTSKVEENLDTIAHYIEQAVKLDAKLIVLPENMAIMGITDKDKLAHQEKLGDGKIQHFLSTQAKKHKVWIVGGTIPLTSPDKTKVYAASLVFNDQGECIAHYNKMHLFDVTISQTESYKESNTIYPGEKVVVLDTPFGKLGLAVCYDVRFPELFRAMFNKGAQIFTLPSAFTIKTGEAHWSVLTRARAIENFCYLIAPAQGGTHPSGRKTYGHSLIVDPWGKVMAEQAGTEPGVIVGEIDLSYLCEVRKAIPVKEHQRIFGELAKFK